MLANKVKVFLNIKESNENVCKSKTVHTKGNPLVDTSEAEFLDEIQTKILRVFILAVRRHLYSFDLKFLFLQTHATSYSFLSALLYTVKEKGGKPDRRPHPLPYGFRNPYRNLKCGETSKK
jgi:hypothetical protein